MKNSALMSVFVFGVLLCGACDAAELVTVENFVRAESDRYFQGYVQKGGFGKLIHRRKPTPIDDQSVIRMNRDTLYSVGVFDLTNPVTIQKPNTGLRFQSLQIISQDHYTKQVAYDPGEYVVSQDMVGTRYAVVLFRTLVDTTLPDDIEAANLIQDKIDISQASMGNFEVPDWDQTSLNELRDVINQLGSTVNVNDGMFGDAGTVNPLYHLIGTAYGWGGNPRKDVIYVNVTPDDNDGTVPYTLTVGKVPADGFWSISVYNSRGYFEENKWSAYSIDDRAATRDEDGRITVHFGGDPEQSNFLPIMTGWNYVIRLYRPRSNALDGSWEFPEARPDSLETDKIFNQVEVQN